MQHRFIVLEGLDGSGKTTLARELAAQLTRRGVRSMAIKTPPKPLVSCAPLVATHFDVDARFLFHLSGVHYTSTMVRELVDDYVVVCDRYLLSTLAYHDAAGRVAQVDISSLNLLLPDVTFYVFIEEDARQARIRARGVLAPGDELTCSPGSLLERIDRSMRAGATHVVDNGGTIEATVGTLIAWLGIE